MKTIFDTLIVLAILICLYILAGCASTGEPKTIIQGAPGTVQWGFTLDLGIIEPIEFYIGGKRTTEGDKNAGN